MNAVAAAITPQPARAARYAQLLKSSQKGEWQIDRDLIQGRIFNFSRKFLPDALSRVDRLDFLSADEARLLSQVQGRTYAYLFGLVERFISAKMLDQAIEHTYDDQQAMEALVRFSTDELKHQELFRRMETMIGSWRRAEAVHAADGATPVSGPGRRPERSGPRRRVLAACWDRHCVPPAAEA